EQPADLLDLELARDGDRVFEFDFGPAHVFGGQVIGLEGERGLHLGQLFEGDDEPLPGRPLGRLGRRRLLFALPLLDLLAVALPKRPRHAQQLPRGTLHRDLPGGQNQFLRLRAVDLVGRQHRVEVGDRPDQRRPRHSRGVFDQEVVGRTVGPGSTASLHLADQRARQAEAESSGLTQRWVQQSHWTRVPQNGAPGKTLLPESVGETSLTQRWGLPYPADVVSFDEAAVFTAGLSTRRRQWGAGDPHRRDFRAAP